MISAVPWRTAIPLMAACLGAAAPSPAVGRGGQVGDPWAIGYSVHVARSCPAWTVQRQEDLAKSGVLPTTGSADRLLPLNGAAERGFYRGQADAAADARRHDRFCDDIRAIAGPRWPRLARVLRRAGRTTP